MFSKFTIGVHLPIARMMRQHPARAALSILGQEIVHDVEDVTDQHATVYDFGNKYGGWNNNMGILTDVELYEAAKKYF